MSSTGWGKPGVPGLENCDVIIPGRKKHDEKKRGKEHSRSC